MEASSLSVDGLAEAKAKLRAADPRMAELVDADPTLDPEAVLDGWPTDLWNALVFQVVGQQLSGGRDHGHPGTARGVIRREAADAGGAACDEERDVARHRSLPREGGLSSRPRRASVGWPPRSGATAESR